MKDILKNIDNIGQLDTAQVVKESYFGKSPELLECEKYLNIMIGKIKVSEKELPKRSVDTSITDWKENKAICRLLEKQFGFKEMYLHWSGDIEENAYSGVRGIITMTVGSGSGMPALPIKLTNGTYYDNDHKYLCVVNIYAGLIDMGFTAEELMSVILHEIGHNFDVSLLNITANIVDAIHIYYLLTYPAEAGISMLRKIVRLIFDALPTAVKLVLTQSYNDYLKINLGEEDKYIDNHKNQLAKECEIWLRKVKSSNIYIPIGKILEELACYGGSSVIMGVLYTNWGTLAGYSSEVFADSFATAYGYGAAAVSTETKFDTDTRVRKALLNKKNKNHIYNDYAIMIASLVCMVTDVHPMHQTRIKNQINILKSELGKSNVPPEVKKAIARDLEKAQKIYDERCLHTGEENAVGAMVSLARFNEKYFNGKLEIRDLLVRILNLGSSNA